MNSFFSQIHTLSDLEKLTAEIDTMLEKLYINKNLEKVLEKSVRESVCGLFKKNFRDLKMDRGKIGQFLTGLKEKLGSFKILRLSIAFEPTTESIESIFSWVKNNLGEGIILDIQTDKNIIGGAVIVFEGIYKDLSIKSKINTYFEDNKKKILMANI